jgi:hypothetical protein
MDIGIIKKYQEEIRDVSSLEEKQYIASQLHSYIEKLPIQEQEEYKTNISKSIERKFEVMDKLIAAYEAIKKDDLSLV